jgi:hypothetical protein
MTPQNLVGLIGLSCALFFSVLIYSYKRQNLYWLFGAPAVAEDQRLAFHFSLMCLGVMLVLTSLLPQIITNDDLGAEYVSAFNPFLLALFPISIAAKLPGERDVLLNLSGTRRDIIVAQTTGLLLIQFIYIIFMYQYAYSSKLAGDQDLEATFYAIASLYLVGVVSLAWWIFSFPTPKIFETCFGHFCTSPVDKAEILKKAPVTRTAEPAAPAASTPTAASLTSFF